MRLEQRIRELRGIADITLKDLGSRTGLSISYLSDIERGRTSPSLQTLEALAQAFNISVADLISGVDFAGESTSAGLPPGLQDLIDDDNFVNEIDKDWVSLLQKIELRGTRPQTKREWMELYLHLKRILNE